MPGTVSRHLYVSSAASSADISEVGDPISAAFSDILRASSRTARSSQATAAGCGLLDDSTDSASAATLARLRPRASAPTDCGDGLGYRPRAADGGHELGGSPGPRGRLAPRIPGTIRAICCGACSCCACSRRSESPFARRATWRPLSRAACRPPAGSASGMPSAVLAMTIASRSSVLASPANSLEAPCAASPGRYARGIPASLARESASEPMLRTWSTTTSAPGYCAQSPSMAFSLLGTGLLARSSPSRVTTHAQCADFPTSSPMTISGLSRWCHGGILQSVRPIGSPPLDTHITWPWRPRPAVSYQSFGAASASGGNTPRALFGAGADGHPEAPDRRPLGACPYRRQCAECSPPKFIGGLSWTVMG